MSEKNTEKRNNHSLIVIMSDVATSNDNEIEQDTNEPKKICPRKFLGFLIKPKMSKAVPK